MGDADTHHLLLYTYVPEMAERRGPHREAHLEHVGAEREAGRIRFAGAFDPPTGGALVFEGVDREHVEGFVRADPYVRAELVVEWRVERWNLL